MAKYKLSLNLEAVRSEHKGFEQGVEIASKLGYNYVEPLVHTGWETLSSVDFFHSFSMEQDPLLMKQICDKYEIKVSSFSAHSPLMKPEQSVPRLTRAVLFADELNAPVVNTHEIPKPSWMNNEMAYYIMKYTLQEAHLVADRHNIQIGIEPHGDLTKTAEMLLKIVNLVDSPLIGVNWDTGNFYLADAEDPYDGLEGVRDYVVHMHAKDISMQQSEDERGKVTGTPVGCACGEGVVDWDKVFNIMEPIDKEIFLSVECGTIEEAEISIKFLRNELGNRLIE